MDNRVFNVNGYGLETLTRVLQLAFDQEGCETAAGYAIDPDKGLILLRWLSDPKYDRKEENSFLIPLAVDAVAPYVFAWIKSDEAKKIKLDDWDEDAGKDDDISTELGWRVYCETWGHIGNRNNTIVAITPAYMWCGR